MSRPDLYGYEPRRLYIVRDTVAYAIPPVVMPGSDLPAWREGRNSVVLQIRPATRAEALALWSNPLHPGWTVDESDVDSEWL